MPRYGFRTGGRAKSPSRVKPLVKKGVDMRPLVRVLSPMYSNGAVEDTETACMARAGEWLLLKAPFLLKSIANDPNKLKFVRKAEKSWRLAQGTSESHERHTALKMMLECYSKISEVSEAVDKAKTAKPPAIDGLSMLNQAFEGSGIAFSAAFNDDPPKLVGTEIVLPYAKVFELEDRAAREGTLPVLMEQVPLVVKAASVKTADDGSMSLDIDKLFAVMPDVLQSLTKTVQQQALSGVKAIRKGAGSAPKAGGSGTRAASGSRKAALDALTQFLSDGNWHQDTDCKATVAAAGLKNLNSVLVKLRDNPPAGRVVEKQGGSWYATGKNKFRMAQVSP